MATAPCASRGERLYRRFAAGDFVAPNDGLRVRKIDDQIAPRLAAAEKNAVLAGVIQHLRGMAAHLISPIRHVSFAEAASPLAAHAKQKQTRLCGGIQQVFIFAAVKLQAHIIACDKRNFRHLGALPDWTNLRERSWSCRWGRAREEAARTSVSLRRPSGSTPPRYRPQPS